MTEEEKNNGHTTLSDQDVEDIFQGAKIGLEDLRKEDGILAKASMKNQAASSVLQRAMTPVDNDNYRALLITGIDPRKANKFVKAKAECERMYSNKGLDIIIDQLHADAGSSIGARLLALLKALTHTSYTVNSPSGNTRGRWFNRNDRTGVSNFSNNE